MTAGLKNAPINRLPRALLSLMDIQSFGKVPNELGNVVQPVVEMTEFYLNSAFQDYDLSLGSISAASILGAFGHVVASFPELPVLGGAVEVPQNEVWLIDRWHACVFMEAGDAARITLAYTNNVSGVTYELPSIANDGGLSAATLTEFIADAQLQRRCWIPPGHRIGIRLLLWSAATNRGTDCAFRMARFKL